MPNPILATATRSGLVEAEYRGTICIVNAKGRRLFEWGDANAYTYPRSAMKLIQVLPLLESGAADQFGFSDDEIAVMCASHSSEQRHLDIVRSIFDKTQIPIEHLQCGTHTPLSESRFEEIARAGERLTPLHNNCSGKHSGFLALAKFLGCDLAGYRDAQHEVQIQVREAVCDICQIEENALHTGVDGCTAPNYAMPIYHLAWGIAKMSQPTNDSIRGRATDRMRQAMMSHPWMVAGTNRFCSDMMQVAQGRVVGKLGAAGFYVMGFPPNGIGVAIKIDSGITGPQYNVAMAVLRTSKILDDEALTRLESYERTPIYNCRREEIGVRSATTELEAALSKTLPAFLRTLPCN